MPKSLPKETILLPNVVYCIHFPWWTPLVFSLLLLLLWVPLPFSVKHTPFFFQGSFSGLGTEPGASSLPDWHFITELYPQVFTCSPLLGDP